MTDSGFIALLKYVEFLLHLIMYQTIIGARMHVEYASNSTLKHCSQSQFVVSSYLLARHEIRFT